VDTRGNAASGFYCGRARGAARVSAPPTNPGEPTWSGPFRRVAHDEISPKRHVRGSRCPRTTPAQRRPLSDGNRSGCQSAPALTSPPDPSPRPGVAFELPVRRPLVVVIDPGPSPTAARFGSRPNSPFFWRRTSVRRHHRIAKRAYDRLRGCQVRRLPRRDCSPRLSARFARVATVRCASPSVPFRRCS
jgi:hypothetical protein